MDDYTELRNAVRDLFQKAFSYDEYSRGHEWRFIEGITLEKKFPELTKIILKHIDNE